MFVTGNIEFCENTFVANFSDLIKGLAIASSFGIN